MTIDFTPNEIVYELDKYIVGQEGAKKSVAIALRNRFRRSRLPEEMREEVTPKNILMIGPTGVGKTEIARRLAKLVNAPFIKVEATKFTEVGYVGRDVESMVRDLVEVSIRIIKQEKIKIVENKAAQQAYDVLAEIIVPRSSQGSSTKNPFDALFGNNQMNHEINNQSEANIILERQEIKEKLQRGDLDNEYIEIEVEDNGTNPVDVFAGSSFEELGMNFQDLFGSMMPKKRKKKESNSGTSTKNIDPD